MRKENLFYNFRREHKVMRPTDKKLATEEDSSEEDSSEEVPASQARAFILISKSCLLSPIIVFATSQMPV